MLVSEAQRDVRRIYVGGFYGQLVSGIIWLVSAGLGTWVSEAAGIVALVAGGVLIFPLTTLALRLAGREASLPRGHPMNALATQIAFTVPIGLVVALGATAHRTDWFYPAAMLIVGAHYLPFVFLYGMRLFGVLAAVLIVGGVALGTWLDMPFPTGGWLGGAALVAFAFAGRRTVQVEEAIPTGVPRR